MVCSPFLSIHLYVDSMVWSVRIHGVWWVVSEVCVYHFLLMYRPSHSSKPIESSEQLMPLLSRVMVWVLASLSRRLNRTSLAHFFLSQSTFLFNKIRIPKFVTISKTNTIYASRRFSKPKCKSLQGIVGFRYSDDFG